MRMIIIQPHVMSATLAFTHEASTARSLQPRSVEEPSKVQLPDVSGSFTRPLRESDASLH